MQKMSASVSADLRETPYGAAADDDEALAQRHRVALLISGGARLEIEAVARRVHTAQFGHGAPFVALNASTFPSHPRRLQRFLAAPFEAAALGTMFVSDLEEMPVRAQDAFFKVLIEPLWAGAPTVRLISGTTVSLLERIAAGQFKEELFYRLNVIHLVVASERAA